MPPPAASNVSQAIWPGPIEPPAAAARPRRNSTRAVASLIRLSPSRMVTSRFGSPIRRATAVAETASGGATTAPRAKQIENGTSGSSACTTNPTANAVNSTSPIASSRIGRRLNRNAGTDVSSAATNSSGGRMPIRTNSASRWMVGKPGTTDRPSPAMTRTIGVSRPNRFAPADTATTMATRPTSSRRSSNAGYRLGGGMPPSPSTIVSGLPSWSMSTIV